MDKDLLFMLENGEEFIKGKYVAQNNVLFFLSVDEERLYTDIELVKENIFHVCEENKMELEILIKEIKTDRNLMSKIKNNPGDRLLIRYTSEEFNELLNIIKDNQEAN